MVMIVEVIFIQGSVTRHSAGKNSQWWRRMQYTTLQALWSGEIPCRGVAIVGMLNGMIGEDVYSSINATDTYLEYVSTWTVQNDREKLIHITGDAYRFFHSLEEVTYKMLKEGRSKHEVISHISVVT